MSITVKGEPVDFGDLLDRAASRLYDRPGDRDDLVDVATILLLLNTRLKPLVREYARLHGATRRVLASAMALDAVGRRLSWLGGEGANVTDDILRQTLDKALRLEVQVLGVLSTSSSAPVSQRVS